MRKLLFLAAGLACIRLEEAKNEFSVKMSPCLLVGTGIAFCRAKGRAAVLYYCCSLGHLPIRVSGPECRRFLFFPRTTRSKVMCGFRFQQT